MADHANESAQKDREDVPTNYNVSEFIFTKRTITYDNKTIQLSNVTRIEKYGVRETRKPIFSISKEILSKAVIVFIVALIGSSIFASIEFISGLASLAMLSSFGVIAYGIYERFAKKEVKNDYYGLIIETSSGRAENLLTNSQSFIADLFQEITHAMNSDNFTRLVANFNDHRIYQDNSNSNNSTVHGDHYQNVSDSTITNRSNVNTTDELPLRELRPNKEQDYVWSIPQHQELDDY